jgi:7-keto-8-aminopelargonate synthetase-like enzyme
MFIEGLQERGFDTLYSETAVVPIICGSDEKAFKMTREAHHRDIFVLPVVSPAVPEGLSRLRATVTAAHDPDDIEYAMDVMHESGKKIGII